MAIQINNPKGEIVFDPYHSKKTFEKSHEKKINSFQKQDKDVITEYIKDMQIGRNVSGNKGKRGYIHLNTLLSRLIRISEFSEKLYKKPLIKLNAKELHNIFDSMKEGKLRKKDNQRYASTHDYIKIFKAFWNWHMKVRRQEGIAIDNIVIDLSGSADHKPEFIYFSLNSLKKLMNYAKFEYKVLMLFMFDTGIRVTELLNVKRKDITPIINNQNFHLNIREETSKTFGRKIKLMICNEQLKEYLSLKNLGNDDFIFQVDPRVANQYLKRLSEKVFGKDLRLLNENSSNKKFITLYDFRHSSCCYWLPIYKSESALKWRFGWKKSDMIYYYSEFLGMRDTIQEDDMLIDTTKTQMEKELEKGEQKITLMQEQMTALEKQLEEKNKKDDFVLKFIKSMVEKGKISDAVDLVRDEKLEKELLKLSG